MALFVGIEDFLLIQFNDCVQNILISAIKTTGYVLSEQEEKQETRTTTQIKKNLHLVTSHEVPLTQLFIHSFSSSDCATIHAFMENTSMR